MGKIKDLALLEVLAKEAVGSEFSALSDSIEKIEKSHIISPEIMAKLRSEIEQANEALLKKIEKALNG